MSEDRTETERTVRWIRYLADLAVREDAEARKRVVERTTSYGLTEAVGEADGAVRKEYAAKAVAPLMRAGTTEEILTILSARIEKETREQLSFKGERSSCDYSRAVENSRADARGYLISQFREMRTCLEAAIRADSPEGMAARVAELAAQAQEAASWVAVQPGQPKKVRLAAESAADGFRRIGEHAADGPLEMVAWRADVLSAWMGAVMSTDAAPLYKAKFPAAFRCHQTTLERVGPEMGVLLQRLGVLD